MGEEQEQLRSMMRFVSQFVQQQNPMQKTPSTLYQPGMPLLKVYF